MVIEGKVIRLSKIAKYLNVGIHTIVETLHAKGFDIDPNPNTKISTKICKLLEQEFKNDVRFKQESEKITLLQQIHKDHIEEGNHEDSFDEIIRDIEEMKRADTITLEDIFPDIEPLDIEHRDDFSDDPNSEENIMRALQNGYGDIYGFD
jgi:translation initiation factor IF-2